METKVIQNLASFLSLQYGFPETDFFRGQSSRARIEKPSHSLLDEVLIVDPEPPITREKYDNNHE